MHHPITHTPCPPSLYVSSVHVAYFGACEAVLAPFSWLGPESRPSCLGHILAHVFIFGWYHTGGTYVGSWMLCSICNPITLVPFLYSRAPKNVGKVLLCELVTPARSPRNFGGGVNHWAIQAHPHSLEMPVDLEPVPGHTCISTEQQLRDLCLGIMNEWKILCCTACEPCVLLTTTKAAKRYQKNHMSGLCCTHTKQQIEGILADYHIYEGQGSKLCHYMHDQS
jgi:hypothetical protein